MATFATNFISCLAEKENILSWSCGEPGFGIVLRHMIFACPLHVV